MDKDLALLIAGIIFGIVALLHLSRLIFRFDMAVGGKVMPLWVNVVSFLVAGGLCVSMFMVR